MCIWQSDKAHIYVVFSVGKTTINHIFFAMSLLPEFFLFVSIRIRAIHILAFGPDLYPHQASFAKVSNNKTQILNDLQYCSICWV